MFTKYNIKITHYYLLIIISGVMLCCNGCKIETKPENFKTTPQHFDKRNWSSTTTVDVTKWREEILPFDSLKINKKYTFTMPKDTMLRLFGEPDETIGINKAVAQAIGFYFYNRSIRDWDTFEYYYRYGDSFFVGNKQIARPYFIVFESTPMQFHYKELVIQGGMEVFDLIQAFPESCHLKHDKGNMWGGYMTINASETWRNKKNSFYFGAEKLRHVIFN